MRDTDRIVPFLLELGELWKDNFPDYRFGQLMSNFFTWLYGTRGVDLFFPEEAKFIEYFKEYCKYIRGHSHEYKEE